MIRRPAPVLVLVLVLAACGGGGDSGGEEQASSTTVTTDAAPPRFQAGSVLDPADLERCLSYAAYAGTVGLAMAAAINPGAAAELEALKAKVKLDEAPSEIRDDFEVIIDYAQGLGEVLARFNLQAGQYDAEAIAALSTYTAGIDQARLTDAGENINAWVAGNCPK